MNTALFSMKNSSNADLPIVGGSILSHDHFQGGCYTFPMAKALCESRFTLQDFPSVSAGIVKWPMGLYHPHAKYHHIKKENIGLIEVMGLAVLPSRLKQEITELEDTILHHKNIRENPSIEKHAGWVEKWMPKYQNDAMITPDNIRGILQDEIGRVFSKVLECAGVYQNTPEGREAFGRFIETL